MEPDATRERVGPCVTAFTFTGAVASTYQISHLATLLQTESSNLTGTLIASISPLMVTAACCCDMPNLPGPPGGGGGVYSRLTPATDPADLFDRMAVLFFFADVRKTFTLFSLSN